MQDGKISPTRLARYAAMVAGTVTAGAQADVQGYFGPPIQLSGTGYETVFLEAGGIQFEAFKAINSAFYAGTFTDFYTTGCEFGKGGGCISTQILGTRLYTNSSSVFITSCVDVVRLRAYVSEGQQVDDALFSTSSCHTSVNGGQYSVSYINCESTDTLSESFYEKFVALELVDPKTGETYFGCETHSFFDGYIDVG